MLYASKTQVKQVTTLEATTIAQNNAVLKRLDSLESKNRVRSLSQSLDVVHGAHLRASLPQP